MAANSSVGFRGVRPRGRSSLFLRFRQPPPDDDDDKGSVVGGNKSVGGHGGENGDEEDKQQQQGAEAKDPHLGMSLGTALF